MQIRQVVRHGETTEQNLFLGVNALVLYVDFQDKFGKWFL